MDLYRLRYHACRFALPCAPQSNYQCQRVGSLDLQATEKIHLSC